MFRRAQDTSEGLKEHLWETERADDQERIKRLMNHTSFNLKNWSF